MRVTGGSARGIPLVAPRGLETRPTTDRTREAIFSILYSMDADLARVLDCYAGSGALAIEALSRGGEYVCLVERAPAACAVIRQNLAKTKFSVAARVLCADVAKGLAQLVGEAPFSVIFLDPPYALEAVDAVIGQALAAGLLDAEGTVVLEHAWRRPPATPPGLALHANRRYGDTGVAFYRRADA